MRRRELMLLLTGAMAAPRTLRAQQKAAREKLGQGDLGKLLRGGSTWTI